MFDTKDNYSKIRRIDWKWPRIRKEGAFASWPLNKYRYFEKVVIFVMLRAWEKERNLRSRDWTRWESNSRTPVRSSNHWYVGKLVVSYNPGQNVWDGDLGAADLNMVSLPPPVPSFPLTMLMKEYDSHKYVNYDHPRECNPNHLQKTNLRVWYPHVIMLNIE